MRYPTETWKPVVGYEGLYEVSDHGRVRSVTSGHVLQPMLFKGYPRVGLCRDALSKKVFVHTLVAAAFISPRPEKHEVNHKDGDPENNRDTNLEYLTHPDNIAHGVNRRGGLKINLVKYVKDGDRWKFVPVNFFSNGRIKHDPRSGTFYLDWRENGKRKRKAVSDDPTEALAEYQRHEHKLALGLDTKGEKTAPTHDLKETVESFLAEKKEHSPKKTYSAFYSALNYFLAACGKSTLEALERNDLLAFHKYLETKQLSQRTIYNKHRLVISFLRAHGIEKLMRRGDEPDYVEEEPEVFEREDLDRFFAACTPEEWLMFQFFLCTGMREQEVMHTFIRDIRFESSVVRVSAKPEFGWSPKKYKGREIPLPAKLIEPLQKYVVARQDDCPLLFPTSGCKPQDHFLEMCKAVAERAGFDPSEFYLHKFRATFATWALQGGVDLATVQSWMGHTDLASTMRYLRPARGSVVQQKVDNIFG